MKVVKNVLCWSMLAGILSVIALFPLGLWQIVAGCSAALIMFIIVPVLSSYWSYVEKNKQLWTLGRTAPGVFRYYRNQMKLASERRHPKCTDCHQRLKRSQMLWLHVPLWVPARKEYDHVLGWHCDQCLEHRLFETAKQVHLASTGDNRTS